jgi:hypothetical protein
MCKCSDKTTTCKCKDVIAPALTPQTIQNAVVIQEYINAMRIPSRWSLTSGPSPDKAALLNYWLYKYGVNYNSN